MGVVYKITNLINNKCYIGKDSKGIDCRYKSHIRLLKRNKHSNTHLQKSWNKYGEENWKYTILENSSSVDVLNEMETYFIKEFCSNYADSGYNKTTGGEENIFSEESRRKISQNNSRYWKNKKFTQEHREKLSNSKKGSIAWNKGKQLSDSHKKHLSENHADFSGKNHPFFGKHHTDESLFKQGLLKRKSELKSLVSPDGMIFDINTSVNKFCKEHGLVPSGISLMLSGKMNSHKGWKLSA